MGPRVYLARRRSSTHWAVETVAGLNEIVLGVQVALLVVAFAVVAVEDWVRREVSDRVWQFVGIVGVALGTILVLGGGVLPTLLWLFVGGFALQHVFPWDERLERRSEALPGWVELALYAAAAVVVGLAVLTLGVGPHGVTVAILAAYLTTLLARGLFEGGLLYGGADAKGMMMIGVVLPIFAVPLLGTPSGLGPLLAVVPFGLTVLLNSALLSVAVPLAIAVRNLSRGEFHFPRSFLGYTIPVRELPERFVWVRDPMWGAGREEEAEIETSEDDRRRRVAIAHELTEKGVQTVWVTPQVPFLVILAAGVVVGVFAGNLLFDILAIL